jgi:class 3 adenylate cyclase
VRELYVVFSTYRIGSHHYIKYLGDGFVVVATLVRGHNCQLVAKFLCDLQELSAKINSLIESLPGFPKPGGFRVRVVAGQTFRIFAPCGAGDYIGYAMNLCARLLDVCPDTELICHESVKDIIGKKDCVAFTKMNTHRHRLDGVEQEDLQALWQFDCSKGKGVQDGDR